MKLEWDHYSDQPEVIRDKAFRKKISKSTRWDSVKLIVIGMIIYPISFLVYLIFPVKKTRVDLQDFFGMSINLDKNPLETKELIDDLKVDSILIRLPLSEIENLQAYINFAEKFKDKEILINILQDRKHIENLDLHYQSLDKIFQGFSHLTRRFQIGNAINRKKWAFFSVEEYLHFYKVAYKLKKQKFPDLILLGSSVIDFEYHFTINTLFNSHKIYFDQCSSLLYVDRRGAPENAQMGLDLKKKLHLLHSTLRLSPKTGTDIVITETNWPIKDTAPYAPTSEKECVSLDEHANFLVRYYLLALASGVVKNVYWHQLIAPGYGLIDNREGKLIKYPAYYAFKTMLFLLKDMDFITLIVKNKRYHASFRHQSRPEMIDIYWALEPCEINIGNKQVIQRDGNIASETIKNQSGIIQIGEKPIYCLTK